MCVDDLCSGAQQCVEDLDFTWLY
uniref:Uncharacterized protein n=1 Tax=Arundo donax TaxID=35708 RepID=A0A0A9BDK6_ARUDO